MKDSVWRLGLHLIAVLAALFVLGWLIRSGQQDLQTIQQYVDSGATEILKYAVVVAAVGTVAMALVELVKALGDILRWFHEWKLRQWITSKEAFDELIFLAIGDRARIDALCGQPVEKMMGQIQAAANVALDFPHRYNHFYGFITTTDVKSPAPTGPEREDADRASADRRRWKEYVETRRPTYEARLERGAGPSPGAPDEGDMEAARTRIRLTNLATRKLDAFQLRTQYYWERSNQLAAVVASVAVMYYALLLGTSTNSLTLHSFLLGLLSGAIAPFAKDLTTRLSQWSRTP